MTSGAVVVLGGFGRNLGAGMTGGEAFVHDPDEVLPLRLNDQLVRADEVDEEAATRLRALLERHVELTGSPRAAALLGSWRDTLAEFRHVRPKADVSRIEALSEGTEHGGAESETAPAAPSTMRA
jgi:glutamate synthase domain-containing protein 3